MTSVLQKVVCFAQQMLHKPLQQDISKQLYALKELVGKLSADDIEFDKEILQDDTKFTLNPRSHVAPVTYVHVFENKDFSAGVFIVRNGARLPLHDHPNMSGILKVIHGQALIQCYTEVEGTSAADLMKESDPVWQQGKLIRVSASPEYVADVTSEPCVLTSKESNIHEIKAVGGVAAFFDILFPPYDQISGSRLCRYYRPVRPSTVQESSRHLNEQYLIEVPQPRDFWCNALPFEGHIAF